MKRLYQIFGLVLLMSVTAFGEYRWQETTSMNQARSGLVAAAADGKIYVFGGMGRGRENILNSTEVFSPENNEWRTLSKLPVTLFRASAVNVNGDIYIIGGFTNDRRFNDRIFVYNTEQDTFTVVARLPEPFRYSHSAVLVDDRILIMGGITSENNRLNTGVWFSPHRLRWEDAPQLRDPAVDFGMAEKDGSVYLAGGVFYVPMDRLEMLSGERWIERASMPIGRNGLGLAFLGDTLYAAGGRTNSCQGITTRVDQYLPHRNTWFSTSNMLTARVDFQLISLDGKLYAIGGNIQGRSGVHSSTSVEVYYNDDNAVNDDYRPNDPVLLLSVFPNPCNGLVNFSFPSHPAMFTLFDLGGRIIHERMVQSTGETWIWNSSSHPAGSYFYRYSPVGMSNLSGYDLSEIVTGSVTVVK